MKKILNTITVAFIAVLLIACNSNDNPNEEFETYEYESESYGGNDNEETDRELSDEITTTAFYDYQEFEEVLKTFTTDVVVARYIAHEYIGDSIVFEFSVSERVIGDAGDRIFIYADRNIVAQIDEEELDIDFRPGHLSFREGVDYLLPLIRMDDAYSVIQEDGFVFIRDIVIDLDNPTYSMMYSTPLQLHTEQLRLDEDTPREEIIAYVYELVKDIAVVGRIIRSEDMEDIVAGSPYVLVIEIGEPIRLAAEQGNVDSGATDLYYVTVTESLKGNVNEGDELVILFHADTVFQGERHIVATMPMSPGSDWHEFTSRNSLFRIGQMDEIMLILDIR
jgi:hypothetical protein